MAYDLEDGERAVKIGAYRQAFDIFMMLCANAEDPAYYKLSEMALNKQMLDEELAQTVKLMTEEVKNRNHQATYNLGILYWRAPYSIKNIEKAVELFNLACNMEVPEAFVALARLYMNEGAHLPLATPNNIMSLLKKVLNWAQLMPAISLPSSTWMANTPKDDFEAFKFLFISGRLGNIEAKNRP